MLFVIEHILVCETAISLYQKFWFIAIFFLFQAETAANTTTTTTTTVKKIVEEVKMGTTKEKKTVTETKEFGGPIGCFFMLFFLPAVVYGVNLACTKVRKKAKKGMLSKLMKIVIYSY